MGTAFETGAEKGTAESSEPGAAAESATASGMLTGRGAGTVMLHWTGAGTEMSGMLHQQTLSESGTGMQRTGPEAVGMVMQRPEVQADPTGQTGQMLRSNPAAAAGSLRQRLLMIDSCPLLESAHLTRALI